jgi:sugar transferase (PEP-CTERM/EpsH1 system associated)
LRILYVAQRVPYPPDRGDKLAAFHAVRYLARRHSVTVATLADSAEELANADHLRSFGIEVEVARRTPMSSGLAMLRALFRGDPLTLAFFRSRELARRIAARARQEPFDVAVSFSSSTGPYVEILNGTPIVADFVDLDSRKWDLYAQSRPWPLSRLYALESRRLLSYERRLAGRAFRTLVRTEAEKDDCLRLIRHGRFDVLANGVDFEYFHPPAEPSSEPSIVFTGVMDYFPNVQAVTYFCDEIMPLVRQEVANATFTIVGARPPRAVRALGDRPGVVVTGTVCDVRPYLHAARVGVAPLRLARGIQNKVLEAMATGLPVVVTPAARRGIAAGDGEGILVAEHPRDFARAVAHLLRSPDAARELGQRGRRFVERACAWETHLAGLERIVLAAAPLAMDRGGPDGHGP